VVTPHAVFLALRWAPNTALANLARLEDDFEIYGKWGFRDSVNVGTGTVSDAYLSLDQGIIMAAIGNALEHDMLRDAFAGNGEWYGQRASPQAGDAVSVETERFDIDVGSIRQDVLRSATGRPAVRPRTGEWRLAE